MPDERQWEPHRWGFQKKVWGCAIALIFLLVIVKAWKIDETDVRKYEKVKESRRGAIRLAKERKETLSFTQERQGVSRNIWIQDPVGPRRQFFLEAASAQVSTSLTAKDPSMLESFVKPKGWFQEELFWEISSTGEQVIKQGNTWVKESSPHQAVAERLYPQIVPAQRVRFFDAQTAEWNPQINKLVANTAFFIVLKVPGHELPSSLDEGKVIARGNAQSMIFMFDKRGRQQVSCQGVKLHLNQGAPTK